MVARHMPPTESATALRQGRFVRTWFVQWRRILTRVRDGMITASSAVTAGLKAARKRIAHRLRAAADIAGRGVSGAVGGIGHGWRRALTMAARGLAPARRWATVRATATDALEFYRSPGSFGTLSASAADRIAALGLRLFLLGLGLAVGLGLWRTGTWRPSAGGALTATMWALARLGVMLWLAPRNGRVQRVVIAAWAASLAPFVVGMTEGLRYIALAASAALCLGALGGTRVPQRDARTMVVWAFGGQATVMVGGIAARALLALVFGQT
ncbi:MAG: hypothetical protein ACYC52_10225 [Coriobacteriia bacterium]